MDETADAGAGKPADAARGADAPTGTAPDAAVKAADAAPQSGECPENMTKVLGACMDLYEAPGVPGALPLVMYTFDESEAWCQAHGKRLCYDDEWQSACEGASKWAYPYGATRVPGKCNDAKTWKSYVQSLLNGWPAAVSGPDVETLAQLLAAARAGTAANQAAADHIEALYQGEGSGSFAGCVGAAGVYDLTGSVEEWTRRRDGGAPSFHGKLKGRYWAETRTCQNGVTTHGDGFRFYEIGFRCCLD